MAYGNIVDYEEGPAPGSYNFTKSDGSKMLFTGPAADDLKNKLDAANKLGPQKTASLGDYIGQDLVDTASGAVSGAVAGGQRPAAPRNVSDAVPNMGAAPGPAPAAGHNYAAEFMNAPAPQQQGAAPTQSGVIESGPLKGFKDMGLGQYEGPDGRTWEYHPPTAGSKGGLVERSRTVSGGFDPNQDYLKAKDEAAAGEQDAYAKGIQAAQDQADANKGFFDEQQRQLAAREEEARQQKAQLDSGVADLEARRNEAAKTYAGAKVDPGQALRGGRNWIAGMIAGLDAFTSTLTGKAQIAPQVIQQHIADNIRAQEAEIAIKKDNADNALADLTKKLGSRDLAKAALTDIQAEQFKLGIQRQASGSNDQDRIAKLQALAAAAQQTQLDAREQYRQQSLGTVTKSLVNVPGSAGSRGGLAPITDQVGNAQRRANLDKTRAELAGQGKGDGAGSADKQKQLAAIKAARAGLDQLELTDAKSGREYMFYSGLGADDENQAVDTQTKALAPTLGRALEGNAPNESTMDAIRSGLTSASGDKRKAAVAAYRQQLDNAEAALNE